MLGPVPSKGCDLMLRMTEGRALVGEGGLSVVETTGFVPGEHTQGPLQPEWSALSSMCTELRVSLGHSPRRMVAVPWGKAVVSLWSL